MDPSEDHHEYCVGEFDPDDIVISGIAGRFPGCNNIEELKESLYSKRNLITFCDERYEKGMHNVPYSSCGIINNLDKFDCNFFRVPHSMANRMDPGARVHMEVVYEAIADAGVDALDLSGMNIGLFNGTTQDDAFRIIADAQHCSDMYSIRTMTPNKTSHALDFTGGSMSIDTACSSAGVALHTAVCSLRQGEVDAAIVSAVQINLLPENLAGYVALGVASKTGKSLPFDAETDGMIRTETISAIFLQRAEVARRAYANIQAIKFFSAGYTPDGIVVPSGPMTVHAMRELLKKAKIDKDEIEYVETHGTGTPVGDPIEINALDEVFCKNRNRPLLIGSIKSNLGHTESGSALSGIIKSILAFEYELIPPHINFKTPNPRATALSEGRISIVTEATPFTSKYIVINNVGFGGTYAPTLLKKSPIPVKEKRQDHDLPRLILFPATTEPAIKKVLDYVQNTPGLTDDFFALLNKLSFGKPTWKTFRGYGVFQEGNSPVTKIQSVSSEKRQVWYIMTGMGCQWAGMGLKLMKLDVFAESMRRSAEVLKPYGVDLFEFLRTDKDYLTRERCITPSYVAICAIQIALIDILKHLGVEPDGIVGHSTGEILCAYADGCLTAEQTLLSTYFRGHSVDNTELPEGAMAAVGASWREAEMMCPKGIYPACHNAEDSVTISGLKEPVEKLVEKLKQENVFVRLVNAHGYSFHCEYIHPVASSLRSSLVKLIPSPKARTERWISTSYQESKWDLPECKTASPDYFIHNLKSCVRFSDALKKIPTDAIVVEIAPHALLQSILKRAIGNKASFIGLMKRNEESSVQYLMESLGKLYVEGVNPKIERLYPPVQFPVARGTPSISNLIEWDHELSFHVPKYAPLSSEFSKEFKFDKDDVYILDHKIDGRSLFPGTGYIYLAWAALADKLQKNMEELPIFIENFKILRATVITLQASTTFCVNIMESTGYFEITEGKSVVSSGHIVENKKVQLQGIPEYSSDASTVVNGSDIYDELRRCGYEYGPAFQALVESNFEGTSGLIRWNGKWIPYLDTMLAFFGLIGHDGGFALPTGIKSVTIDPNILKNFISQNASTDNEQENATYNFPVSFDKNTCTCRSVGVEITSLTMDRAAYRGKDSVPTLEEYRFVPYESTYTPTHNSGLQLSYYLSACNELISKIGNALRKDVKQFLFKVDQPDDYSLGKVLIDEPDNNSLLTVLKSTYESSDVLKSKEKDSFLSYASGTLGDDLLNNSLVNEDSIRIMLEIISENTFRKLNAVEIYSNFPIVLNRAAEIMRRYSYTTFRKCILVAPKTVATNQEQLDANDIQVLTKENLKDLAAEKAQDVAIGSFMCGSKSELQNALQTLTAVLKPNGFILFFFKEGTNLGEQFLSSVSGEKLKVCSDSVLQDVLKSENLVVLSKISDHFGGSLYLLRTPASTRQHTILHITESSYGWVQKIKEELYEKESSTLWLVSEESSASGVIGLVNCLKQEPSGERIRCVLISQKKQENSLPAFNLENPFYEQLITKNLIMNVWKDGCWGSFRHILIKQTKVPRPVEHSFVQCLRYGDLSSFEWVESNVNYVERKNQKLLHIYYSALNFKDVMLATGKLSLGTMPHMADATSVLGVEFAGREDGTGKRFCGFSSSRGMATAIWALPEHCIEVPDNWTLEEAATVPIVYLTCYYALIMRGNLQRGESILIHSATGGIGMAAINIALSMNCEVFATVGNDKKRKYLREKYPQIKDENIGCSRDTSFKNMVLQRTNGKGVNVVLNSLADEKFQANFELLSISGRFLEIGKYDLLLDRQIGLKIFLKNISFHAIAFDWLFVENLEDTGSVKKLVDLVRDGIKCGVVKPLDRTTFDKKSVEEAFRYMSKGIHVGKVLLKIREEETPKCIAPKTLIQPAVPKTQFYHDKVYIIIGGLGGFGMEVAKWIIVRGGRNLILTSRYGARTPYHFFSLLRWRKRGVNAQVSTLNVGIRSDAERLLKEAARIGPVGAIFNSAVVLSDAFMETQTPERYQDVCTPKAEATRNLDELSRKLCPSLDYFVCFSSISCGRGNAGQTNYGYANSVMERVCEERRNAGLHGLAIQWGIIGEVGVVHRHMGESAVIAGVMAQNVRSCLDTLDAFCQQECPVVSTYVTAEQNRKSVQGDAIAHILKILGASDISQINTSRTLGEMGMDSIVRVEVKQALEFYTDVSVSLQEIPHMKFDDIKALFDKEDAEGSTPAMLSTTRITLPTVLVQKDSLVVLNKDGSGDPVFIVHIGDTDVMQLQNLSKIINKPLYALVWTKDIPSTDVESLASNYLKIIADTTSGPFHIMGHSFGGRVAIEMALQSAKTNKTLKTITLMRSSDDLYKTLNSDNADVTDHEAEALCRFVQQFGARDVSKLKGELQKASGLELREEAVIKYLMSSSSQAVDKAEVSGAISNYLQKYKLIESYIPGTKLSKDITLLEDPAEILANDVSKVKEVFSQVCSGKISINRVFSMELLSSEDGLKRIATALQNIV